VAALWHYEGGRGYQPMVAVWVALAVRHTPVRSILVKWEAAAAS
jgi:hypothetical protein